MSIPAMKLDKKFSGAITKVKDGTRVPDDQWIAFLAKDTAFAQFALPAYRQGCIELGADAEQIAMVDEMIANVEAYRTAFPERCKVPDAAGELRLR